MKQVLIRSGQIKVINIPAPLIEDGYVLVEVAYSLISTGTEVSSVEASGKSLFRQAVEQPEKIAKLITHLQQQGIQRTVEKVKGKQDEFNPLGYSCAGRVLQVGSGIVDLRPGEWVACAGAGLANHAEIVLVPRNLIAKVPDGCNIKAAACVTLGAIAMQGVRRASAELGNFVAVIGLALLGQITVQLLKIAGCQVIGFDLDPRRVQLASQLGADRAYLSSQVDVFAEVDRYTTGQGTDATIIAAASSSDVIVQQAMEMTRKKGRVVVVGAVGLGLKRSPFYEKEIDFLISSSYGPGRYDPDYEMQGHDYPYAYVRWTENRNMGEFLRLLAGGFVSLDPIIEAEFPIEQAERAYQSLMNNEKKPLAVLLRYPSAEEPNNHVQVSTQVQVHPTRSTNGKIGVALVGAGNFARSVHLPNLINLGDIYQVKSIVDASGVTAISTAEKFGAEIASTRFEDILGSDDINLVMICTRHDTHAKLALQALQAGKHVFVEKPLALSEDELIQIEAFYNTGGEKPVLTTGFNRRFSPIARHIMKVSNKRENPMIINYRMNAGYIPLDHWVHGPQGGGRNLGEACHIYDLFTSLTNSMAEEIEAESIRPQANYYTPSDNFIATVRFGDGSLATLTYTALGSAEFPKEQMEIFVDGKILSMDDYRKFEVYGITRPKLQHKVADKGHLSELKVLGETIRDGGEWPIPLWQQLQAMRIALVVEDSFH